MNRNLIYDLGLHVGEDTEYYLKKGFQVVAVEANPSLCESAGLKFATAINNGQLILVKAAVARQAGTLTFFKNAQISAWGTTSAEWAKRNEVLGTESEKITVPAVTIDQLIAEHGVPYYVKVDIEGSDRLAIEALVRMTDRPKYASFEAESGDFDGFARDVKALAEIGYDRFQLVKQQNVPKMRVPRNTVEGKSVDHQFVFGSSGPFGEDLPKEKWMSKEELFLRYRRAMVAEKLFGYSGMFRKVPVARAAGNLSRTSSSSLLKGAYRLAQSTLGVLGLQPGHYDFHARMRAD